MTKDIEIDVSAEDEKKSSLKNLSKKYGKTGNNGDDIAIALKSVLFEQLPDVAKKNGLDFTKWSHLNKGMQRMNLGNSLRSMWKSGEDVKIGAITVTGQEQTEKAA